MSRSIAPSTRGASSAVRRSELRARPRRTRTTCSELVGLASRRRAGALSAACGSRAGCGERRARARLRTRSCRSTRRACSRSTSSAGGSLSLGASPRLANLIHAADAASMSSPSSRPPSPGLPSARPCRRRPRQRSSTCGSSTTATSRRSGAGRSTTSPTAAARGWCCASTWSRPRSTPSTADAPRQRVVALTPPAGSSTRPCVEELAAEEQLTLLSARFEGFDERIVQHLCYGRDLDRRLRALRRRTAGDGDRRRQSRGSFPARSATSESGRIESFSAELDGGLEYPHYTSPAEFRGWHVPDVLLSGRPRANRRVAAGREPRRGARLDGIRAAAPADLPRSRPPRNRLASRTRMRSSPRRWTAPTPAWSSIPRRKQRLRGEPRRSRPSVTRVERARRSRNPVVRYTATWPRWLRVGIDWTVDDRWRDRDRTRDQGLRRQPVPDPVVVDGADAPLRAAGLRLRGAVLRPRAREPLHLSLPLAGARGHHRLQDAAGRGGEAAAPAARSSSGSSRFPARRGRSGTASSISTASGSSSPTSSGGRRDDNTYGPRQDPGRASTSSWATTARSRATRASGAPCQDANLDRRGVLRLLAADADRLPRGAASFSASCWSCRSAGAAFASIARRPARPFFPMSKVIQALEQRQLRKDLPQFKAGDTVKVHFRVIEGSRSRIQVFEGHRHQAPGRRRRARRSPCASSRSASASSGRSRSTRRRSSDRGHPDR